MTTANTWYDGASVSLTAGTWLVIGHITMGRAATTATNYVARLYSADNTTLYSAGQMRLASLNPHVTCITISTIVTTASTITMKLQGVANVANSIIYYQDTVASTANVTKIVAVKIAS
jgi:hypothetical protein